MHAWAEEFGVEGDWTMRRRHRIRWVECDMHAHVNHAAYLTLCEDLRVAHWLALGGGFGGGQPGPVVSQLEVRYLKPLRFGDEVALTLRTAGVRRSSFTHEYAIWKAGAAFTCRAVVVVIGADGRATAIPPDIRARLLAEGARDETA